MSLPLSEQHSARYREFQTFVSKHVQPVAGDWDRDEMLPRSVLEKVAASGYLGSNISQELGGKGWDTVTFGLLSESFGRGSSSLAVVVTVQAMVTSALVRWGTAEQKTKWLPDLAKGKIVASFALTEPETGSATENLATQYREDGTEYLILSGRKKWISCAQFAGLFLVFGKLNGQSVACMVPRETSGLAVEPIAGLLGFRAAGLAQVHFDNVRIPKSNMVGKPGFALSHIASVSLQFGRLSTASSALGLLRACFEDSIEFAVKRKIGGKTASELGMIQTLLAGMGTDLEAGGLLCQNACLAADDKKPEAFEQALMAKYFTSRAVVRGASDAVQILGAAGCHESAAVSRYYRDAKIMEIIEGTTQIHEHLLGKLFVAQANRLGR